MKDLRDLSIYLFWDIPGGRNDFGEKGRYTLVGARWLIFTSWNKEMAWQLTYSLYNVHDGSVSRRISFVLSHEAVW